MSNIRNRLEAFFYHFAATLYDHPLKTLLILLLFIIFLVFQLPRLKIDTSTEGFFLKTDQPLIEYNKFRDQFGRDEIVIVALKPGNVFDLEFLRKLKTIHDDFMENTSHLNDITSLINIRNTRGEGDTLIVEDLLEKLPVSEAAMKAFENLVMANRLYRNTVISEDGSVTTILLESINDATPAEDKIIEGFDDKTGADITENDYLTDEQNSAFVTSIEKIAEKYRSVDCRIHVAGSPLITHHLKVTVGKETQLFISITILCLGILLLIMFCRFSGMLLPLLIVILSLMSTLALMAVAGIPISLVTQILPSFLLVVGVGDAVHILAIFFYQLNQSGDKRESLAFSIGHSGLAILMTSITTAGGLLSFSGAKIAPISDLGIFGAVGVMIAFVYTVVLLPVLISLLPIKPRRSKETAGFGFLMEKFLETVGHVSAGRPRCVLLVMFCITVVFITGIFQLRFSHNVLKWLPETNMLRSDTEFIDRALKGSVTMDVVLDTGRENGLYDPGFLKKLDHAGAHIETFKYRHLYIGKAWSLTTIVKEINRALNKNQESFYSIPDDRRLIAQEILLFENSGSDDMEKTADSAFSKARLTIKAPFDDSVLYADFIERITAFLHDEFPGVRITFTGMMTLFFSIVTNTIFSMMQSYITVLIVVTVLMILLIGRAGIGLISMIPNIFPVIVVLGVMGWFDIPVDFSSAFIGSIIIGIAVDDTIHFFHNFRRYFEVSGDTKTAIMDTLQSTGRAMTTTTIVLGLGFSVLMCSSIANLFYFGLLSTIAVVTALAADFVMAPAMLVLVNKNRT